MILVIGSGQDVFVQDALARGSRTRLMMQVDESAAFDSTPFAIERRGSELSGFVQIRGARVDLVDIHGVILRPPRAWWPSADFDLCDQMFVYHETMAAWYSLFASLPCPVVNRFGLGWWLQDVSYAIELRDSLARVTGFPVPVRETLACGADHQVCGGTSSARPAARDEPQQDRSPAPLSSDRRSASVYLAGEEILPVSGSAYRAASMLGEFLPELERWRAETGLSFCRLDFELDLDPELAHVEVFPTLDGESEDLRVRIADAVLETLGTGAPHRVMEACA